MLSNAPKGNKLTIVMVAVGFTVLIMALALLYYFRSRNKEGVVIKHDNQVDAALRITTTYDITTTGNIVNKNAPDVTTSTVTSTAAPAAPVVSRGSAMHTQEQARTAPQPSTESIGKSITTTRATTSTAAPAAPVVSRGSAMHTQEQARTAPQPSTESVGKSITTTRATTSTAAPVIKSQSTSSNATPTATSHSATLANSEIKKREEVIPVEESAYTNSATMNPTDDGQLNTQKFNKCIAELEYINRGQDALTTSNVTTATTRATTSTAAPASRSSAAAITTTSATIPSVHSTSTTTTKTIQQPSAGSHAAGTADAKEETIAAERATTSTAATASRSSAAAITTTSATIPSVHSTSTTTTKTIQQPSAGSHAAGTADAKEETIAAERATTSTAATASRSSAAAITTTSATIPSVHSTSTTTTKTIQQPSAGSHAAGTADAKEETIAAERATTSTAAPAAPVVSRGSAIPSDSSINVKETTIVTSQDRDKLNTNEFIEYLDTLPRLANYKSDSGTQSRFVSIMGEKKGEFCNKVNESLFGNFDANSVDDWKMFSNSADEIAKKMELWYCGADNAYKNCARQTLREFLRTRPFLDLLTLESDEFDSSITQHAIVVVNRLEKSDIFRLIADNQFREGEVTLAIIKERLRVLDCVVTTGSPTTMYTSSTSMYTSSTSLDSNVTISEQHSSSSQVVSLY